MIRRFNYTDRQKIPRDQISLIWVESVGAPLSFRADISLELPTSLPPRAHVLIEAHSGPVVMRFSFGTVERLEHPADTTLSEFPPGLKPLFRVKVVEPDEGKRILAWADAITPLSPDEVKSGKRSILPVETLDISPLIWKLRIDSNQFRLQLNSAIREPRAVTLLALEPDFIALVYPAVVRQILQHLLLGPEQESVEPNHDWLLFGAQLAGRSAPEHDDADEASTDDDAFTAEVEDWIQSAVAGFCSRQRCVESFIQSKKEAEEPRV